MIAKTLYYPKAVMDRVKAKNDIIEVLSEHIPVQRSKDSPNFALGECPFDSEEGNNLLISGDQQLYQCISCGANGDVFQFLMNYKHMSLTDAVEFLAQRAGIEIGDPKISTIGNDEINSTLAINREAALFYYQNLYGSNGTGLDYLRSRGIEDKTIRRFGLGYAGSRSDDLYQHLVSKGFSDKQIEDSGLVSFYNGIGYDKFRNRAMCPIIDTERRVLGFSGRIIGEGEPKYKNSPTTLPFDKKTVLFGMQAAQHAQKDSFIVCEGNFDVISLHQAGFDNAIAPLGTAFTKDHASIISQYRKTVHLVCDSDEAGIKATLRIIPMLQERGMHVDVVNLEPYKDPDEFIKGEGAGAFQSRLDNAESAPSFEVRNKFNQIGTSRLEEKREILEEFARFVLTKPSSLREEYIKEMNERLSASAEEEITDPTNSNEEGASTLTEGASTEEPTNTTVDTSWVNDYPWFAER